MATDNFKQLKGAEQDRIQSFAFVIAASVCILFCIGFAALSLAGSQLSQKTELDSRINPNDAPLAGEPRQ